MNKEREIVLLLLAKRSGEHNISFFMSGVTSSHFPLIYALDGLSHLDSGESSVRDKFFFFFVTTHPRYLTKETDTDLRLKKKPKNTYARRNIL